MEVLKGALRDYGAAIGPALAFLFAGVGVLIKYQFDRQFAQRSAQRKLKNLQRLILENPPPPRLFPTTTTGGIISADQARNLRNNSIFYSKLLVINTLLAKTETSVNEAGTLRDVERLAHLRWFFDITFKDVQRVRSTSEFSDQDYADIREDWESLAQSCADTAPDWNYTT